MKSSNTRDPSLNGKQNGKISTNADMQPSELMKSFENELKEVYSAEQALIKAIPKMIQNSTSIELIEALLVQLEDTYVQVGRLVSVFSNIEKRSAAKKHKSIQELMS